MQKKALGGMILVLVALILVALSLLMPWYRIEQTASSNGSSQTMIEEYYMDHAKAQLKSDIGGISGEISVEVDYTNETLKDEEHVKVFQNTQLMVFIGLIGCIIGLIGAAMVMVEKLKPSVGAILVFLALILCLLAPIYLMMALPAAFKAESESGTISQYPLDKMGENFFGSESAGDENLTAEITWGGTTGWFLGIIAMVMCIIALVLVAKAKPVAMPAPPAQPATFTIEPAPQPMAPQPEAPVTFQPEGAPVQPPPPVQPPDQSQGEQFQCPKCARIFILATKQRPAILNCPYCGLEGLVE